MATVTNNMTRIHDAEGALTTGNIPAGGAGAAANTDIFLQGAQSLGKRITETAGPAGFSLVDAADNNVSAASVHVGVWWWVTHFSILDAMRLALSTGTTPATNYDYWDIPLTEYPKLGGWVRTWVDVSVPTGAVGTGLDETALRCYGMMISFTGAPGGNAANLIIDAADFVAGAALSLTGTSGVWSDFTTADENATNQFGVFRTLGGVYNCFARVQLGTASSLVFTDSNFTIVFPQQSLVEDSFMGITCDLQHASTVITWSGGVLKSAGAKRGDLVVSGTAGDLVASGMTFSALRVVTLTAGCSVTDSTFIGCGQITHGGAITTGCSVSGYAGTANTSAMIYNETVDPSGEIDGMTFTKGSAAAHAIEFGTSSPTTITLNNVTFTGYNASNGQNDSAIHIKRTTGSVTVNVSGGNTPSYRTDGATVTIVNSNTLTLTGLQNPTEVRVYDTATDVEIAGQEDVTSGSFSAGVDAGSYPTVYIMIVSLGYIIIRLENLDMSSGDVTIPVQQQVDRQYQNP